MSRIAYIISAYKDAPHLSRLIKALDEDADFYVHIDRKADSRPFKELLPEGKVTFVQSHWVSWGGWEQVEYQKEPVSCRTTQWHRVYAYRMLKRSRLPFMAEQKNPPVF
ncbi:hypothetical protein NXX53_02795 [Bacteroides salyersiae]|nr:hypothetical protein [Bacteroides salyersiae]